MATLITNVTELQAMKNNLSANYELANDIDASATSSWNGGLGFEPVGTSATPFTGSLDGKGYAIDQLFINRPSLGAGVAIGLFGYVYSGTIQNVGLTDVDMTGGGSSGYLGALVGLLGYPDGDPTIDDCYSTGSLTHTDGNETTGGLIGGIAKGTVTDCYSTATIVSNAMSGGFVGRLGGFNGAEGTISCCASSGNVTAGGSVGGFTGYLGGGVISKCYALGNVTTTLSSAFIYIGGFVGNAASANGVLNDCYARGNVNGYDGKTGGFVGQNRAGIGGGAGYIDDCYSTGIPTTTHASKGGFCGDLGTGAGIFNSFWDTETSGIATSDGGTGKTTAQMKTQSTFTDAGWNFTTVWFMSGVNFNYPGLLCPPELLPAGVVSYPSDPRARVTGLIHRYTSANVKHPLTLELLFGGATYGSLTTLSLTPPIKEPELTDEPPSVVREALQEALRQSIEEFMQQQQVTPPTVTPEIAPPGWLGPFSRQVPGGTEIYWISPEGEEWGPFIPRGFPF